MEQTMISKIQFLEKYKEYLTTNMYNHVTYQNKNYTVLMLLFLILMSEQDLQNIEYYEILLSILIDEEKYNESKTNIIDVLKNFVRKIYTGTTKEREYIDKLCEYQQIQYKKEYKMALNC